jgi:hypothetical protein
MISLSIKSLIQLAKIKNLDSIQIILIMIIFHHNIIMPIVLAILNLLQPKNLLNYSLITSNENNLLVNKIVMEISRLVKIMVLNNL